jgi:hypothetical protein
MFGTSQLRSCMAPYYCARCNDNVTLPVTADEVARSGETAPAKSCTKCQSPMEFDELDGYFSFFKLRVGK